jgi:septal ring factor EnvC (AmiA/AmiB activator)
MKSKWTDVVAIVLTVLSMMVGAVVWASSQHIELKEWTAEQDFVTQNELKEVIKEQYVPRHEFAIVGQKLENYEDNHKQIIKTLDKLSEKIDNLDRRITKLSTRR